LIRLSLLQEVDLEVPVDLKHQITLIGLSLAPLLSFKQSLLRLPFAFEVRDFRR